MFVRSHWVHYGAPFGIVEFVQYHWIHWGALWESLGSFGVARFIGVRTGDRHVCSGSLGTLGCALGVVGFLLGHLV